MATGVTIQVAKENAKNEDYAISLDGVSKFFRIPREKRATVYDTLMGFLSGNHMSYDEFWALKDISFNVRRGETFGIIGSNGSGKSTLLKIMARVLYPDSGNIFINGKVAPFLELGVGFHPDLTAKENVYLYSAIMGLSKRETEMRYQEIMTFAELKRFENMKLKNFSSGMVVRLAFSTAIQVNPDIMLIDEVLTVGDEAFQKKCKEKINSFRKAGKTIVFVSHDLTSVSELCERCLLLKNGHMIGLGKTSEIIDLYHNMNGTPI
jgi:lipopolysaccharide transport system ATP-binding protein